MNNIYFMTTAKSELLDEKLIKKHSLNNVVMIDTSNAELCVPWDFSGIEIQDDLLVLEGMIAPNGNALGNVVIRTPLSHNPYRFFVEPSTNEDYHTLIAEIIQKGYWLLKA